MVVLLVVASGYPEPGCSGRRNKQGRRENSVPPERKIPGNPLLFSTHPLGYPRNGGWADGDHPVEILSASELSRPNDPAVFRVAAWFLNRPCDWLA